MQDKYYKGLSDDMPETWIYGRLVSNNQILQEFEPLKGACGIGIFSVVPKSITEISEKEYYTKKILESKQGSDKF